jgi:hypothetical protein
MPRRLLPALTRAFAALIPLTALAACGSGETVELASPAPHGFSAELLPGTDLGGGSAGTLELQTTAGPDGGMLVALSVSEARGLRAFYARVNYDAARYTPLAATPTSLQAAADKLLSLADMTQPGVVYYGQVLARALEQPGFSGSGVIATLRFESGAAGALRQASTPPLSPASAPVITNTTGSVDVYWNYANQGDYDQNGLVTIADLTPIGIYLGQNVTDPALAIAMADGDGNGLVNISDITPIGANFGHSALGGFEAFRSADPADYPADPLGANGAGTLNQMLFALTDAINYADRATQRLRFKYDTSSASGFPYVWVRATDGTERGICSNLLLVEAPEPPVTLDGQIGAGDYISAAIVDGNPAVAYQNGSTHELYFVRATDAGGTTWGAPVAVDTSGINNGLDPSLAVVNGKPAVSYYLFDSGDLKYVQAGDAQGTGWGAPVSLDTAINSGQYNSLAVVNGNPAISYYDATNFTLRYIRALDPDGTGAWGAPVTPDPGDTNGGFTSLRVVNGNPAIAHYRWPGGGGVPGLLRYVRALDANGASWGSGQTLDEASSDAGVYPNLLISSGVPLILHFDAFNGDLRYIRAQDANGDSWDAGGIANAAAGPGDRCQAALLNGRVAVAYRDAVTADKLYFDYAVDLAAADWHPVRVLDANIGTGISAALLELPDDKAGVAYGRADSGLLFQRFSP